jgi:aspartyl-tRNA(Asn)/glutamyl-tRNA(Gln) amidotransferase subunit A
MTKPLNELSITEAAKGLRAKEFSVRELWDACAAAAKAKNGELNAYLELFEADDAAIDAAQKRVDAGDASSLCGIPLAMKDNILIEGKVASAASRMLENYRATYDATVTRKLKEAGALFVGRTNMDEFALGGSTENSAFGVTKNPHDTTRVAGGTSGGSAAAVAAHMCIAALGTDTGGSVRNPASFCGVVGIKPTYGGVSRSGVIAAASSLEQVGPITKTVEDAKIVLDCIRGKDALDSTTYADGLYPYVPKRRIRVGMPAIPLAGAFHKDIIPNFMNKLKELHGDSIEVVADNVNLASFANAVAAYYIVNFAEVSANLARYDGIRYGLAERGDTLLQDYVKSRTEGFGAESVRRILLGTFVLSSGYIDAYYRKAEAARAQLRAEFDKAFESVDVIATPTMPTPAFKIGEKSDPLAMYLEDIFTVTANLTGMPAISVPMDPVEINGVQLPAGIQFTAPRGADDLLFTIGAAAGAKRYNRS